MRVLVVVDKLASDTAFHIDLHSHKHLPIIQPLPRLKIIISPTPKPLIPPYSPVQFPNLREVGIAEWHAVILEAVALTGLGVEGAEETLGGCLWGWDWHVWR